MSSILPKRLDWFTSDVRGDALDSCQRKDNVFFSESLACCLYRDLTIPAIRAPVHEHDERE